ncbi:MAG: hypothetical protein PSX80_12935 [bacterium]|nr:hypothetical protein [bacterium]
MRNLPSIINSLDIVPRPEYRFGWGAPPATRTTTLTVTMLGDPEMSVAWPQRERVGLIFKEGESPLKMIETLLKREGFRSPEELKHEFEIPHAQLTCRTIDDESDGLVKADANDPKTVLRQALILGLCGPTFYDPLKAVIWTNNRLSRKLDLFEPGRWYADN